MKVIVVPVIILGLIGMIFVAIQTPDIDSVNTAGSKPDFAFTDVKISFHKKGKKTWEVHALESEIYNVSDAIFMTRIDGRYYNAVGQSMFRFKSPFGLFRFDENSLNLVRTEAMVSYEDTEVYLVSDESFVDINHHQVFADGHVQINSNYLNIDCESLGVDLLNGSMMLNRKVEGIINVN